MKQVFLHGRLAEFGEQFTLEVRDPAEAIRALTIQLPGFREAVTAGQWHVVRGSLDDGSDLAPDDLCLSLGHTDEIHILPATTGAGGKFGQILLGAVLIGAAFVTGGGAAFASWGFGAKAMGAMGLGLVAGGVAQMLMTPPSSNFADRETPDQRPSFLFDGPVNTSTQGLPVPLIYGEVIVGSVVISAGMTAEDIED